MHKTVVSLGLALGLGLFALAGPARADIKSFNAAMQKGDYKAAAAEAASTWPGLDKSRKDLAVIAREFGFAAYLAGEFASAKMYGEAASGASKAAGEPTVLQLNSDLLWRLAEHRLAPSGDTRRMLYTLLQARATDPSIDLIAYLSAEAVAAYDFDKGLWRDATTSAEFGAKLTANREGYQETSFRFEIVSAAAHYMAEQDTGAYRKMGALQRAIITAIGAAPSNKDVSELMDLYYEANAWGQSMESHLEGRNRLFDKKDIDAEWRAYYESPVHMAARPRLRTVLPEGVCVVALQETTELEYPRSALFRGMVGTIVLRIDIDPNGRAYNPRVVAAVPAKDFAETALASVRVLRFRKTDGPPGCTLAQKDKIVTFVFKMP